MAALVQTQLHKFEGKVKPFLHEGPFNSYWDLVEEKAKVKREQVALGLIVVVGLYLTFGWANDFICDFIGFIYPAYASVLAIESKGSQDDTEWLIYWVVYAVFGIVEYVGHNFFHTLPFYWLGKCILLLWLMAPGKTGGSHVLYNRLIRPMIIKQRPTAEKRTDNTNMYVPKFVPDIDN